MRNHEKLVLKDSEGNFLEMKREGGCFRFVVEDQINGTTFLATATHMGKIFEYTVEVFFPGGKGDESAEDSQDRSPK